MQTASTTASPIISTTLNLNSPYIILLDDETSFKSNDEDSKQTNSDLDADIANNKPSTLTDQLIENNSISSSNNLSKLNTLILFSFSYFISCCIY